ncbi:MAG: addiction module protein [Spartobacteria bacterium]|nr:addiction module protein [Spartobacteria bacterium]
MTAMLDRVEKDALCLPEAERAFLVDRLINSLGENAMNDVDAAWLVEIEKRFDEYKRGTRKPVPSRMVFEEAEQMTK